MIIPEYWAEGRVQERRKGRQITIRRFGWSDTSQAEAQTNADARAEEALQRMLSGERLARREPKIPYNGAEGVPIREEILSRHGETIITRNSYGARCLNTPTTLFADIDFQDIPTSRTTLAVIGFLLLFAAGAGWLAHSKALGIALALVAIIGGRTLVLSLHRAMQKKNGGEFQMARSRIDAFIRQHPTWNLRLYRTPAGLRILVTHRPFSPQDPEVVDLFQKLRTDPLYVKMCLNQQCFRARVSPKPWRIGIQAHIKPRPGTWPVSEEQLPKRNAWVANYEASAKDYSACTYLTSVGSGVIHPAIQPVQELHDDLCRAFCQGPIA